LRSKIVPEAALARTLAGISGSSLISLAPHADETARARRLPGFARKMIDPIDPTVARQLPRRFSEQRHAILVTFGRSEATLAMADPFDDQTRREAQDMLSGIPTSV